MKLPRFIIGVFLITQGLMADVPLRECTLTAPASAVSLTPAQQKPYRQGGELVLKAPGLLFKPSAKKNIEAAPTQDNSTPYRTAINYHRSLRNDDRNTIASYWHPSLQEIKRQQLAQPGVMAEAKQTFGGLDHVEMLGLLDLNNRQVVFIRYHGKTRAYVTVKFEENYYLVSDPGLQPQIAIACAAFDSGSAMMAAN